MGKRVGVVSCLMVVMLAMEAAAAVRICRSRGVDIMADNTGVQPVSTQFQRCIDENDPTVKVINLEPGTYLVDKPIVAWREFTIRTAGLATETRNCQQLPAGRCATFLASTNANACINNPSEAACGVGKVDYGGLLQGVRAQKVIFDHLIIDGNRANRQHTNVKQRCAAGENKYGFNSRMHACEGPTKDHRCQFTYNLTRNALCGTGLEWSGDFGRIQGNAAFDNGVHLPGLWADGLTIVRNNNGIVNDNRVVNSTDVGLIFGAAENTQIQSNWIQQVGVYAFAGMMLGNFAEATDDEEKWQSGNYTGASVRFNTIQCPGGTCGFGLNFGPDAWVADDRRNVFGGTVTQNTISGARVLINFGGAGESGAKTTVTNNTLTAPATAMPVANGSGCIAVAGVVQNLYRNNTGGMCGNWVTVDGVATSAKCFRACFASPPTSTP